MLSKRCKYALGALVELARHTGGEHLPAALIAERARVPYKFLEAILVELRNAGLVASRKGRGGGHLLARDPSTIHMAEVVRLFDGAIGLVPCVTYHFYERCEECKDEVACGIRDVFVEARQATVELLKKSTLADIIEREERLTRKKRR